LPSALAQAVQFPALAGASMTRIWPLTLAMLPLPCVTSPDGCQTTPVADHHHVVVVGAGTGVAVGFGVTLGVALADGELDGAREPVAKGEPEALMAGEPEAEEPGAEGGAVVASATMLVPMPKSAVTLGGRCQSVLIVQVRPSGDVHAVVAPCRAGSVPTVT